ncbi:MAG: MarR family transcriptional regulator [Acidimicrobiia bacterium]|nr:MarR family transcriptional regulator [Acidimicrobiia bacterium]
MNTRAHRRRGSGAELQGEARATAEAALRASRALVAVAASSMGILGDITLPQYRALVILAQRGPLRAGELAEALGVHPSTLTRLADRLARKDLIERRVPEHSRREVEIHLLDEGRSLVAEVSRRRLAELTRIVASALPEQRAAMLAGFEAFADAAGEQPEDGWALPWT